MDSVFEAVADFLVSQSCQLIVVFSVALVGSWCFRNKSAHWRYMLWLLVIVVLTAAGKAHLHTRDFKTFLAVLLALTVGCVLVIVRSYRKGERITREPLKDD